MINYINLSSICHVICLVQNHDHNKRIKCLIMQVIWPILQYSNIKDDMNMTSTWLFITHIQNSFPVVWAVFLNIYILQDTADPICESFFYKANYKSDIPRKGLRKTKKFANVTIKIWRNTDNWMVLELVN